MTRTYRRLTGGAAAAIGVLRLTGAGEYLRDRFSAPLKIGGLAHGQLRNREGQTIDDPVVAVLSDEVFELSLHGGVEVMRQVEAELRAAGFEPEAEPPATAPLSELIEHYLPLCRTELAVRVLLAQENLAHQEYSASRALHWLLYPPTVAIIGRPNVGKSTLVNALAGSGVAITADLPGTTRDYVLAEADLDGLVVRLLDTPGIRETADAIEHAAIGLAASAIQSAHLRLLVVDSEAGMLPEDKELYARWPDALVVWNRADRGTPEGAIATIATTGTGIDALVGEIHRQFDITPGLESRRMRFASR